jgi:hypothetical protein
MSDRRQQTSTATDMRDGDYEDEAGKTMANERRGAGGVSTADMAAAMEGQKGSGKRSSSQENGSDGRPTPLFPGNESESFRSRWTEIQTGFVDEPRHAVEAADGLVAEVIQRLAATFAEERKGLEQQWGRGSDVSTEDLRVSLQRYRSFFERLLST